MKSFIWKNLRSNNYLNDKDNIVNQLLYSDCQENENPMNYKIYSKNHLNEFMSNNKLELLNVLKPIWIFIL